MNWHKDDREGRFLLRRIDEDSQIGPMMSTAAAAGLSHTTVLIKDSTESKNKMSKREKKALKKQEKQIKKAKDSNEESSVAEKLYSGYTPKLYFLAVRF